MEAIGVISYKGGTGKTTVSVALSLALARAGERVALLDGDTPAPDLLEMLGVEQEAIGLDGEKRKLVPVDLGNGLKVFSVASMFPKTIGAHWDDTQRSRWFRSCLSDVEWGDIDRLVIDLPPGTSPEFDHLRDRLKSTVVIVVTPSKYSLLDNGKLITHLKRRKLKPLGVVENMAEYECSCGRSCKPWGTEDVEAWGARLEVPYLGKLPFIDSLDGQVGRTLSNHDTIEALVRKATKQHSVAPWLQA